MPFITFKPHKTRHYLASNKIKCNRNKNLDDKTAIVTHTNPSHNPKTSKLINSDCESAVPRDSAPVRSFYR